MTREINLHLTIDVERLRVLLTLATAPHACPWADVGPAFDTTVVIREHQPSARVWRLAAEDLARGLERLALDRSIPDALDVLCNAVSADPTERTADIVLQLTVFGEVLYG